MDKLLIYPANKKPIYTSVFIFFLQKNRRLSTRDMGAQYPEVSTTATMTENGNCDDLRICLSEDILACQAKWRGLLDTYNQWAKHELLRECKSVPEDRRFVVIKI